MTTPSSSLPNSKPLSTDPAPYVGIEIGGTELQIVQGNSLGHIHRRWRAVVDRTRGGPGILGQLREGLAAPSPSASAGR